MRKITLFFFILVLLGLGSGCATQSVFLNDRWNDFADCFKGDVGYGFGLGAHVRATELFSVGAGGGYMWKNGFKGRYVGEWTDILLGWPVANVIFAFNVLPDVCGSSTFGNNGSDKIFGLLLLIPMNEASIGRQVKELGGEPPCFATEFFDGGFSTHSIVGLNILPLECRHPEDPQTLPPRYVSPAIELLDIEAGVMAGFVSLHFGFSPGQFADFLLGWCGLDIADDDIGRKPLHEPALEGDMKLNSTN